MQIGTWSVYQVNIPGSTELHILFPDYPYVDLDYLNSHFVGTEITFEHVFWRVEELVYYQGTPSIIGSSKGNPENYIRVHLNDLVAKYSITHRTGSVSNAAYLASFTKQSPPTSMCDDFEPRRLYR